jgi:hypothetical protein
MTLSEFNALDLERRCEAIWEWGFYLSRHKTETTNKVLYSLNGFFAEMIIRLEDSKIIDVSGFNNREVVELPSYFIKSDNPFIKASSGKSDISAIRGAA